MKKDTIEIPLDWMKRQFFLDEIGTLAVLTASPELDTEFQKRWGDDPKFKKTFHQLKDAGYIVVGEEGMITILSEIPDEFPDEHPPMTVDSAMNLLTYNCANWDSKEDMNKARDFLERMSKYYYDLGYEDRKVDNTYTSYGKTEDFE